jgi:hypothetical protein
MLWVFLVIPGVAGGLFFGYFCLVDYAALRDNFARFQAATPTADLKTLFVLESRQNMHRINVFADGVWALMCLGIAGLGVHGLALRRALLERASSAKP